MLNAAADINKRAGGGVLDEDICGEYGDPPDEHVRDAVRRPPPRQRDVLFLRYYLDFDYATIGQTLGIKTGTVSATLHAAHRSLRNALQEVTTRMMSDDVLERLAPSDAGWTADWPRGTCAR